MTSWSRRQKSRVAKIRRHLISNSVKGRSWTSWQICRKPLTHSTTISPIRRWGWRKLSWHPPKKSCCKQTRALSSADKNNLPLQPSQILSWCHSTYPSIKFGGISRTRCHWPIKLSSMRASDGYQAIQRNLPGPWTPKSRTFTHWPASRRHPSSIKHRTKMRCLSIPARGYGLLRRISQNNCQLRFRSPLSKSRPQTKQSPSHRIWMISTNHCNRSPSNTFYSICWTGYRYR